MWWLPFSQHCDNDYECGFEFYSCSLCRFEWQRNLYNYSRMLCLAIIMDFICPSLKW